MRRRKVAVAALALSLLAGGCVEHPEEVDPGVLEDVGKIGTIAWKQRYEGLMGNETVVTDVFLVDVGGKTGEASFKKAVASLHRLGWVTSLDDSPNHIWLVSPKWKGANLAVYTLLDAQEDDKPEVKKILEKRGVERSALVEVSAYAGY